MPNFIKKALNALGGDGIVKDVTNIIDEVVTSKEEKEILQQKLLEIKNNHEQKLKELEGQDVSSARKREVNLRNTIGVWVQNIAAGCVILAFLLLLFLVVIKKQEVANRQLADILLGSLGVIVTQIFQYWFGSSRGSEAKNETIK